MIRIISSRKLRQLERDAAAFRRAKEGYQMNTAAALGGSYAPAIGPCVVTGIDQPVAVCEGEALEWNLTIRPLTLEERMHSKPFLPDGKRIEPRQGALQEVCEITFHPDHLLPVGSEVWLECDPEPRESGRFKIVRYEGCTAILERLPKPKPPQ